MAHNCGTERWGRRGSPATVAVLREALEALVAGDRILALDELRRHLARAEENLARVRLRGGRYRAVQMSPYMVALSQRLQRRRKAG